MDMAKQLLTWQESGNHVILPTDFIDDVESPVA